MPLSLAWVAASFITGQLITRTGRYRRFPLGGAVLVLAGMLALTVPGADISAWLIAVALSLVGFGMGSTWPIYVVATQNAVEHSQVGVATAVLIFFRTMGGSIGVAVMGAVFAARLTAELAAGPGVRVHTDRLVHGMATTAGAVQPAVASSLQTVFLLLTPLALATLALAARLEEKPLRSTPATGSAPA